MEGCYDRNVAGPPPTLLFDGDCGICTVLSERAKEIEARRGRYGVEPYQAFREQELETVGLDYQRCSEAIQLVEPDGTVRSGAFAVNRFLWGTWWSPLVALLYLFPPLLLVEVAAYRLVAVNRHKISAMFGLNACKI